MVPEILIVGDASARADLVKRIEGLGYDVTLGSPQLLAQRVSDAEIPSAVIVCLEDVDPHALMAELRGNRQGLGVPVSLHGPLDGEIDDLADVIDLGADHFLEEPTGDEQLAAVLLELVGPGLSRTVSPPKEDIRSSRAGAFDEGELGPLHRTLDRLESKLQTFDDLDHHVDDIDLAALGFTALPGADDEPPSFEQSAGPSESSLELPLSVEELEAAVGAELEEVPREHTEKIGRSGTKSHWGGSYRSRHSSSIAQGNQGSLVQTDVPRLLWALGRASFSGALSIEHGRAHKRLWWRNGEVVFARSSVAHDRFVDGLLHRGLLTRTQYDTALDRAIQDPRAIGDWLVEVGWLKPAELPRVVQQHLIRIVDSMFPWSDGHWMLSPDEVGEESALIETPVSLIIAEGVRHRMQGGTLEYRLGGLEGRPQLSIGEDVPGGQEGLIKHLQMTPSEAAWLHRFDGSQSLQQLIARSQTDALELLGLVYILHVLECVTLQTGDPITNPLVDPAAIDLERVKERLALARAGEYFALLGLPRDAGRLDVRRAYAQLKETFSEHHLEPVTRERLSEELEEVRERLAEAYDVLVDEGLRMAYLAHLEES